MFSNFFFKAVSVLDLKFLLLFCTGNEVILTLEEAKRFCIKKKKRLG